MLKKLFLGASVFGLIIGVVSYITIFFYLPGQDPHGIMTKDAILETLKSETVVLYADEASQLGTFFNKEHRRYVTYDEIPPAIINGLIAGEDQNFFSHGGFDFKGFSRAIFKTITTGRKQGGSTLTQQTAKNLFGLHNRSLITKIEELIYARRLEYYFSKDQILEFYLNQFYVAGTGRGVAIASKYFFNKELSDLTTRECAFIAGSVKGPSNYDPFIKYSQKSKDRAIERGHTRSAYILKRMHDEGYLTTNEYSQALNDSLDFSKGAVKSSLSTPMQWVYSRMHSDLLQEILLDSGITHWEDAQLTIVTTLRKDLQDDALAATRDNISRLDMLLNGYSPTLKTSPSHFFSTTLGEFGYAQIDSIVYTSSGKIKYFKVNQKQVHGEIPFEALTQFTTLIKQYSTGSRSKATPKEVHVLCSRLFKKGDILYVQTINNPTSQNDALYAIAQKPNLSGANYLIKHGKIQAAVNGFNNRGYDRIQTALRQFGSAWKPLLIACALENGWHHMDLLENKNNVFKYSTLFYYPNPDHKVRGDQVTLTWAATRSENIASISLLTQLTSKLTHKEYWNYAEKFGYSQAPHESQTEYVTRLRDSLGIPLNSNANFEQRFSRAKEQILTELTFKGYAEQVSFLNNMVYGIGYLKEARKKRKSPEVVQMLQHTFLNHTSLMDTIDNKTLYFNFERNRYSLFTTQPSLSWSPVPIENYPLPIDSLYINGGIQRVFLDSLRALMGTPLTQEQMITPASLRYLPDFNTLLSMSIFVDFCKTLGLSQEFQKVLSLPLGANDTHLSEITHAYETLLTGSQFKGKISEWGEGILIEKILDRTGNIIFSNSVAQKKLLSDVTVAQMATMLKSVIENGTGQRAHRTVSITSPGGSQYSYPLYGKTGTTNSFKNAAFIGGIAGWDSLSNGVNSLMGYTLGSYVGYDNNEAMHSKALKVSGSSGPLFQWATIAQSIITRDSLNAKIDFLDFEILLSKRVPAKQPHWGTQKAVSKLTGIPIPNDSLSQIPSPSYIYTIEE